MPYFRSPPASWCVGLESEPPMGERLQCDFSNAPCSYLNRVDSNKTSFPLVERTPSFILRRGYRGGFPCAVCRALPPRAHKCEWQKPSNTRERDLGPANKSQVMSWELEGAALERPPAITSGRRDARTTENSHRDGGPSTCTMKFRITWDREAQGNSTCNSSSTRCGAPSMWE